MSQTSAKMVDSFVPLGSSLMREVLLRVEWNGIYYNSLSVKKDWLRVCIEQMWMVIRPEEDRREGGVK